MENKICEYRMCDKELIGLRSHARFCCRNHKNEQRKIRLRTKKRKEDVNSN